MSPNSWATFIIKFDTKKFQKSPNLVILILMAVIYIIFPSEVDNYCKILALITNL